MKSDSEEQGIRELMHISIGMVKIKKKNDFHVMYVLVVGLYIFMTL